MNLFNEASGKLKSLLKGEAKPLQDVRDQSPEDQAIVSYVKNRLEEFRNTNSRIANESIWLTNTAYFCGYTSIYFDSLSKQFRPINYPNSAVRRYRSDVNKILPTVQNRLARLVKTPPRYDVKPNSGDEEDKDAARLAKQVLEDLWDRQRINQKRLSLMMYVQQCGHAYLKVTWDETLGRKRVVPDGQNEDGSPKYKMETEGDIRVDVVSPFEVFVDPLAKTFDEVQELIQVKARTLDYFKLKYPEKGHLVKEEDVWLNSVNMDLRVNSLNSSTGAMSGQNSVAQNSALEISYYCKPSKEHPFGRHIITANGVKLKDSILPIDEIPFAKFDDILVGGKYASEAVITHLRPIQDSLNKNKSLRSAWLNRLLTGKYIAARGHGLAAEAFNDQSGEVVEYDHIDGHPEPHAIQPPTVPEYAYKEEETSVLDMNDTSGINEASRGQMPSASIPAIGMQLLVEQDDTRIGVETESHEYAYADLGRIELKFVGKFYGTERVLHIAGQNMEYTVRKFKGDDLRENFDVSVIRGSTLPGSKVLKRQEIINLHQSGYFGNPQDPLVLQNVLSMLEYGDEYQAWKRHSLVMAQIQRGIDSIEKLGEPPHVSEFDKHDLWIQELDNFRLSERFIKLDPEKQAMVLDCMNAHTEYLQDMMAPTDDPNEDPELVKTNAAEQAAQELEMQTPPAPMDEAVQMGEMTDESNA